MQRKWEKVEKGTGPFHPANPGGCMEHNMRSAKESKRNIASAINVPYLDPSPSMAYTQANPQNPRFSVLSSSSLSSAEHLSPNSSRFSLPNTPSINTALGTPRPNLRPNIYDRHLNKTRTSEVSASSFAYLFSEAVQYTQKRVSGINDLERRYSLYFSLLILIFIPSIV